MKVFQFWIESFYFLGYHNWYFYFFDLNYEFNTVVFRYSRVLLWHLFLLCVSTIDRIHQCNNLSSTYLRIRPDHVWMMEADTFFLQPSLPPPPTRSIPRFVALKKILLGMQRTIGNAKTREKNLIRKAHFNICNTALLTIPKKKTVQYSDNVSNCTILCLRFIKIIYRLLHSGFWWDIIIRNIMTPCLDKIKYKTIEIDFSCERI